MSNIALERGNTDTSHDGVLSGKRDLCAKSAWIMIMCLASATGFLILFPSRGPEEGSFINIKDVSKGVQQVQTQANPPLVGHIVTANDQIPVSEVPQNGTPAYFPMQDGSSILAKSWQPDGTIATVRYIPEVQQSQPQEPSQQDEILRRLESLEGKITQLTESLTN